MTSARKSRIISAFDRANDYDANARIQREVARRLAASIDALPLDPDRPALEIGCGTGFLTEAIAPRLADFTASDIAPVMLDRARRRLGDRPGLAFARIDGESPPPPPPGGWGLIASSLAFQWFERPAAAVARLYDDLAPGGWLAIATLAPTTFAEWHAALRDAGLAGLVRNWPDPASFHTHACVRTYVLVERFADGLSFLRALRAIGAATPWQGSASPAALRHAIAGFEANGAEISYAVAELLLEKPGR